MFGWKKKYLKLEKKYDELCAMDCQKLYGDECIRRERAETNAEVLAARVVALEKELKGATAWLMAVVKAAGGEVTISKGSVYDFVNSGKEPMVAIEDDTYRIRLPEESESCATE